MNWIPAHSKTKAESVCDSGISVNWRAAIMSANGEPQIFGRLSRLGLRCAEATLSHGLLPGSLCHLVVMLPRNIPDEARRVIEGRCKVVASSPAAGQFRITFGWEEMLGEGDALLRDCMAKTESAL